MIVIPPEQIPANSDQVQTLATTTSNPLSAESDCIHETDRAPAQPLPTDTIEINQSATYATDEAVSTPLSSLSLRDLKAKAAELGITDPSGHKGHKSTWIEALIEGGATFPSKPPPEATDSAIWLVCDDGTRFAMKRSQVMHSGLLCSLIPGLSSPTAEEDHSHGELSIEVPVLGIDSSTLNEVVDFLHRFDTEGEISGSYWPERDVLSVLKAANQLDIQPLLDVVCAGIGNRIGEEGEP